MSQSDKTKLQPLRRAETFETFDTIDMASDSSTISHDHQQGVGRTVYRLFRTAGSGLEGVIARLSTAGGANSSKVESVEEPGAKILNIVGSPSPNKYKVLLLGASQSGKSTVLKQFKLLYLSKTTQKEYETYIETIFSVLLFQINAILDALPQLGLELLEKHRREAAEIQAYWRQILRSWDFIIPPDIFDGLSNVLSDPAVKAAIVRSNEFQLTDSATYFFDSLDRISAPNYTPTDQDILRSYIKTTGIVQTIFPVGKSVWDIYDAGGVRAERKKWIHCFDNVDAIIFVAAISEYDQMLYEDDSVNRLQETLVLWDSISNSKWFTRASVILFLNKFDVLASKISKVPMGKYFLDYTGGSDYRLACDYILNRFLEPKPKGKPIFTHFTCATDTNHMCTVLLTVEGEVAKAHQDNIESTNLL